MPIHAGAFILRSKQGPARRQTRLDPQDRGRRLRSTVFSLAVRDMAKK